MKKNVIIILIDGGTIRFCMKNLSIFKKLTPNIIQFEPIQLRMPHILLLQCMQFLSGCYGNRTGVNSYWNIYQIQK